MLPQRQTYRGGDGGGDSGGVRDSQLDLPHVDLNIVGVDGHMEGYLVPCRQR